MLVHFNVMIRVCNIHRTNKSSETNILVEKFKWKIAVM
jgi:hypothetical protein